MESELDLRNGVGAAHLVMAPLLPLLSDLSHIPSLSVHCHPSLGSPAYRVLFVRGRVGAVGGQLVRHIDFRTRLAEFQTLIVISIFIVLYFIVFLKS